MKKHAKGLLLIFLTGLTSSAFSYDYNDYDDFEEDELPAITPNAGPKVDGFSGFFFSADFIYWTAREDGIEYAETGAFTGVPISNANVSNGKLHDIDYGMRPGFKVDFGLNIAHDGWDIYSQYTWLHTNFMKASTSIDNFPVNQVIPTWNSYLYPNDSDLTFGDSAKGRWKLNFNALDLQLGRNFYASHFLKLRPFIGLKGSWQDQKYRVNYFNLNINNTTSDIEVRINQDFWGLGISGGIQTSWQLARWFSFYGDLAVSSLWSQFNTNRKDTRTTEDAEFAQKITRIQRDFHTIKNVLEMAIGIRFEAWLCQNKYRFLIQTGWEEQVWFSQNQFPTIGQQDAHGDLIMQGFSGKFRFDF